MSTTADRLLEAMRLRGTDQSALARDIGSTQGAISKIVLGKTANSRLLPKIATHLGVPLPWLLGVSDALEEQGGDDLSFVERDWVDQLRALKPQDRKALLQLTRSLAAHANAPTVHGKRHAYRAET